jgi:hypothetical protein
LAGARAPLLAVVGCAAMVPGSAGEAAARVNVPIFIGVGEHDIAVDHHAIPAEFPASGDITLFVLQDAGHNHNVEPGREQLWARIISWAGGLSLSCSPGLRPPRPRYDQRQEENVMTAMKPGERFRCATCGTEILVLKPGESAPECCGTQMESPSATR